MNTSREWPSTPSTLPASTPASRLAPPPPPPLRWGLGDVLLGIPIILGVAMMFTIPAVVLFGEDNEAAVIAISSLGQFGATLAWPWIVTRWKGRRSLRLDFGLTARPVDLAIGLGLAVGMLIVGGLVALGVSELLGIDPDDAGNTAILEDNETSPWIYLIAVVVVVVGPVAEELFFRGLALRALLKSWGRSAAMVGSAVIFALPHVVFYQDGEWKWAEQVVLWSQIGVWGLVWAWAALRFNRLGPTIVSHVLVNGVATSVILFG